MTNEEKKLLFKVLCGMLPYGVICNLYDVDDADKKFKLKELSNLIILAINSGCIKPYLRPMSSMTGEEYKELKSISPYYGFAPYEYIGDWCPNYDMLDWLNAHHFDYRGLIPMGLALEAPAGMYK